MKVVILGDGLLGKELAKQTQWSVISRTKNGIDFNSLNDWKDKLFSFDVIVNCIAFTKTYDNNKQTSWDINVKALDKLIDYCNSNTKKLVHISTDYVYAGSKENCTEEDVPVHLETFYGYTKLVGDAIVQLRCNDYLLCRLSHKPTPFVYESAWTNIQTNCDYVNVIADLVVRLIKSKACGVFNVGTKTKSMYELALKTNKNVNPSFKPANVPANTTMDLTKLNNFLKSLIK